MSEQHTAFFDLLAEGYNVKYACEKTRLKPKSVHALYKKYNKYPINKFSKYKIKGDYFDNIDTEEKAYFLGFLIADGCVMIETIKNNRFVEGGKGYKLAFGIQDEDGFLMDIFSKELGFEKAKKNTNNQEGVIFRKLQRRFRFNNKHLVETLINKYKIIPRKTLDTAFEFPLEYIPKHLIRHFVRGFFDGDGCVTFTDKGKIFYFNFSFIFTSLIFAKQIGEIFENTFQMTPVYIDVKGKTVDSIALRFRTNRKRLEKMKEVFHWFYKDSVVYLERKKVKFEKYFEYLNTEVNSEITKGSESL